MFNSSGVEGRHRVPVVTDADRLCLADVSSCIDCAGDGREAAIPLLIHIPDEKRSKRVICRAFVLSILDVHMLL